MVLGLSIRDLVDTEPFVGGSQEAWEVALDILNVVELGGERVVDIDDDDLPVGLFLIEESHDTQDLDLLDLASITNQFTDFADIERIVIALGLGLWVNDIGVFPGL